MVLILVLPLHAKWNALLGNSRMGDAVIRGFGADFFSEFTVHHPDTVSAGALLLALFAGAALVLNLFFNGGLIACFVNSNEKGLPFFFENSSRFFGRFLLLFLISLPLLIAAFIVQSLIGQALRPLAGGTEPLRVGFTLTSLAVFAVLVCFINMVMDYAKIITVKKNRRDMVRTTFRAFRFILRNPGKTIGLYSVIGAAGLAVSLAFLWTIRMIDVPSGSGLFLLFLWQQLHALFRVAVRMEFFSAQSALYRALAR
jgi:hypothetical protein